MPVVIGGMKRWDLSESSAMLNVIFTTEDRLIDPKYTHVSATVFRTVLPVGEGDLLPAPVLPSHRGTLMSSLSGRVGIAEQGSRTARSRMGHKRRPKQKQPSPGAEHQLVKEC